MLLRLFLTFLKINCLSPSGPASVGITQKLVVPDIVSQDQFNQVVSISASIPGSDAIQMAYQIGYHAKGYGGAFISVLGAMLPTVIIITLIMAGMKWIKPGVMKSFFSGMAPAIAIYLIFTAFTILPKEFSVYLLVFGMGTVLMMLMNVPVTVILLLFGLIGVFVL